MLKLNLQVLFKLCHQDAVMISLPKSSGQDRRHSDQKEWQAVIVTMTHNFIVHMSYTIIHACLCRGNNLTFNFTMFWMLFSTLLIIYWGWCVVWFGCMWFHCLVLYYYLIRLFPSLWHWFKIVTLNSHISLTITQFHILAITFLWHTGDLLPPITRYKFTVYSKCQCYLLPEVSLHLIRN